MKFIKFIQSSGFTAKSLAEKAGISVRTVESYTCGRSLFQNTRLEIALCIAGALGVPVEKLLEFDEK